MQRNTEVDSFFFFFKFLNSFYLQRLRWGGESACWLIAQVPIMPPAAAKSQELDPGLQCGWQEPSYFSHDCCLQGLHWWETDFKSRS